jgi:hypothetical protein
MGEPEAVLAAGESFYEAPNAVHLVSANASPDAPVKFLAYFTCDRDTPLSAVRAHRPRRRVSGRGGRAVRALGRAK